MLFAVSLQSQCTNCEETENTGQFSTAIGKLTKSTGLVSFASGFGSEALGYYTTSIGFYSFALGSKDIAIGSAVKANGSKSIVIGAGEYNSETYLINAIPRSLMVGFNSQYPTLFVSEAPISAYFDKTGKIGIGNITSPQTKLHLLADEGEEAAIFIQPNNWDNNENSTLYLGSLNTYITANKESGINFHSEGNYMFGNDANVLIKATETETSLQIKDGDIYIEDIDFGIIMKSPNRKCWRGQLDDNGQLNFSELENCPETVTSVNDNKQEESGFLKVFPNPANNTLNIELQGDSKGQKQVLLYNSNGMIVYTDTFVGSTTQINVTEFKSGIYIVKVGSEANYVSSKVNIYQ